ncbi:hypothetical protein [Tenacibaculum sp. M341]|uniref:hypothetical protein n=1 Tax=Tenacibaculum sp. M341 TaxID=2530339 RepID=UPI001045E5A2|nr:hypothetical protein [Tenacibaculum sp. M341]TCI91866.1 hypothetical protein EYW44_09985 [Tenacibaculum sp. M341]
MIKFFSFDKGKGRAVFGRNDQLKGIIFYIGLQNDNLTRGIGFNIRVVAVKKVKEYHDVIYNRQRKEPNYLTLHKVKLKIREKRVRIPVE